MCVQFPVLVSGDDASDSDSYDDGVSQESIKGSQVHISPRNQREGSWPMEVLNQGPCVLKSSAS